ncbi:MAG TPA: non-canonical purine NTP pyrophosphatase [Opitutaceae bacterium]|jgi:XTP/dITP diphosphohydrolase
MRLYLASANPNKAAELGAMARALGAGSPVDVRPASEVGGMPAVVEDAGTFTGNARKKAEALLPRVPPGDWALADDSGICVDALGGGPGVESAYYAGASADAGANLRKLVREMSPVPDGSRGAHYVCVLYLVGPGGEARAFEGRCHGTLAREPRGSGGFGYDPVFVPEGDSRTIAEMAPAEKDALSHRGRAFASCVGWLAARG